jgi:hypothetical protein
MKTTKYFLLVRWVPCSLVYFQNCCFFCPKVTRLTSIRLFISIRFCMYLLSHILLLLVYQNMNFPSKTHTVKQNVFETSTFDKCSFSLQCHFLHTMSVVSVMLLEMWLENYHKIGFKIAVLAVVLFQIVAFAIKLFERQQVRFRVIYM